MDPDIIISNLTPPKLLGVAFPHQNQRSENVRIYEIINKTYV